MQNNGCMGTNQNEQGSRRVTLTTSTNSSQMTIRSGDGTRSSEFGIVETAHAIVDAVATPGAIAAVGTGIGVGAKHAAGVVKSVVEQREMTNREIEKTRQVQVAKAEETRQVQISETEQTKRARIEHGRDEPNS